MCLIDGLELSADPSTRRIRPVLSFSSSPLAFASFLAFSVVFLITFWAPQPVLAQAKTALTEADKEAYSVVQASLGKVKNFLKLKRTDEALKVLKAIKRDHPGILKKSKKLRFYWHRFFAIALERKKRLPEALEDYKKAAQINPKDVYSNLKAAVISFKLRRDSKTRRPI